MFLLNLYEETDTMRMNCVRFIRVYIYCKNKYKKTNNDCYSFVTSKYEVFCFFSSSGIKILLTINKTKIGSKIKVNK
jgi:hypothetical protein